MGGGGGLVDVSATQNNELGQGSSSSPAKTVTFGNVLVASQFCFVLSEEVADCETVAGA